MRRPSRSWCSITSTYVGESTSMSTAGWQDRTSRLAALEVLHHHERLVEAAQLEGQARPDTRLARHARVVAGDEGCRS
jgi:hypothetical protein